MSIPLVPITPRRAVDDFTTPESREASDEEPYGGEEEGRYFSDAERRLAFNPNHASALRSRLFANAGQNLDNPDELHSPLKHTIYDLMEDPTSSTAAFVVHVFTTSLIVLSAVITVLETLPPFHSTPSLVWFGLETALVVCFTVEYLCRAFAHSETQSSLWKWMTSFFSVIDLLAILPYYIEIALQADTNEFFRFSILRTSRLLRVFRPFRYSNTILLTIEVMYLSMKRSKDALLALGFFVLMVLIVFSTLLYFAERGSWDASLDTFVDSDGNPTQFESIPGAAWFVLVTITTVGFGEIIPRTILGRFFTIPLLLFGLLLIALPSFVLGRQFSAVWEAMAARGGRLQQSKRERANSLTAFLDAHDPQHQSTNQSRRHSPVHSPESRRGSREDLLNDPAEPSSSRQRMQSPRQASRRVNKPPRHAYPPSPVATPLPSPIRPLSIGDRRPHLTNRKLARNQQALSRQIEEISIMLRGMKEQLAVLQMQKQSKGQRIVRPEPVPEDHLNTHVYFDDTDHNAMRATDLDGAAAAAFVDRGFEDAL